MSEHSFSKVTFVSGSFHVDAPPEVSDQRRASLTSLTKPNGRTLSSLNVSIADQKLSDGEKRTMQSFSSLNYSPSTSQVYKKWLASQGSKAVFEWDRWLLCLLIGITVGLTAALLKQATSALGKLRLDDLKHYSREDDLSSAWCWNFMWTVVYTTITSFVIVWLHPLAAGGGTPEIIAYLNGVLVHGAICLKQLIVKFIALVFTVSAGFPVGIQGPLIVFGACIGTGIGQFRSRSLGISPPLFRRFRNKQDRRSFTTVGLAAGVSSGFDAPIGSLMLAMEDMSTFWSRHLAAQTFFGAIIAILTSKLFNTAYSGFEKVKEFGILSAELVIPLNTHIATVAVAIVLGVAGGIIGALYTRLSAFIVSGRKTILSKIPNENAKKLWKMLDVLIFATLWCTYNCYFPSAFSCDSFSLANYTTTSSVECYLERNEVSPSSLGLESFTCNSSSSTKQVDEDFIIFNPVASLVQNAAGGIHPKTWKRGTHLWYDWYHCLAVFALFTIGNIYVTTGCSVAGGIFVPLIVSGSLLGRALAVGLLAIWKSIEGTDYPVDTGSWDWLDPGMIAVIGSAAMLGGVTRLAIASTVFMVEMSRDIELTIPIMMAALIARTVGEALSKSLWKYLTDIKGLPVLEQDPKVVINNRLVNLDLFEARDIMASPVTTIRCIESLGSLCRMLMSQAHGAIPVVRYDPDTRNEVVHGMITRSEVMRILLCEQVHDALPPNTLVQPHVEFEELSIDIYEDPPEAMQKVERLSRSKHCDELYIDLSSFVNKSAQKVDEHFSLHRAYHQFRTLGLRHLLVTDMKNRIVGIITRKDLMQYKMEEKLSSLNDPPSPVSSPTSSTGDSSPILPNGFTNGGFSHYLDNVSVKM